MAMEFTKEQKEVIEARDSSVLVSAAAGSGKTAVLVQRIIELITGDHPVDIDELLVVTFTNAAAAQMKERILKAVSDKILERPEDQHLQRQETLIHHAQITTIDAFCQYVIRNNFNDIGLDPGYRVADEGEVKLLQQAVMEEMLEKNYEEADPDFLFCMDFFAAGGSDVKAEAEILRLYRFAESMPWPRDWVKERSRDYDLPEGDLEDLSFIQDAMTQARRQLTDALSRLEGAFRITEQADGPYMYSEMLQDDMDQVSAVLEASSYEAMRWALSSLSYKTLSRKKDEGVDPFKRDMVRGIRDGVKKVLKNLLPQFFSETKEDLMAHMKVCARALQELCRLTLSFMDRFDERKRKENVIDFGDMEHFALQILVNHGEDGMDQPSQTAISYRSHFKEIMIDEYQDSNAVQELLLSVISGEEEGRSNRFMVGDVKQSIYKFRLARPEIFMEKLGAYRKETEESGHVDHRRIDLHRNFRSRREVLDSVNYCFERIMGKDLGGVSYDHDAMLQAGADFPKAEGKDSDMDPYATELLIVKTEKDEDEEENNPEKDPKRMEALTIAARIKDLLQQGRLSDGQGGLRPARYRDMVILLRALSGYDDVFRKVLTAEGIPTYVESRTGYFNAPEVAVLLNLLSILDNPLQDIPLVSVMHSALFSFSDEELAVIRAIGGKQEKEKEESEEDTDEAEAVFGQIQSVLGSFYHIVVRFAKEGSGDNTYEALQRKAEDFLALIRKFRQEARYLPVHELLEKILEETGYRDYITAMPAGEQRRANVDMLLERAIAFERTNFRGLFHFVRYIEQLVKYDVDYGEANILDEQADVVRIMSIHKSKGLEFPIVFLAGLSKKFNTKDSASFLTLDVEKGIGLPCVMDERRLQVPTLRRSVIANRIKTDVIGEELRVLYVAMTRAKEKLILTGQDKDPAASFSKFLPLLMMEQGKQEDEEKDTDQPFLLPYSDRAGAGCFYHYLLMALIGHPAMGEVFQALGLDTSLPSGQAASSLALFHIEVVDGSILRAHTATELAHAAGDRLQLAEAAEGEPPDPVLDQEIRERLEAVYPHKDLEGLFTKTSVTELKEAMMEDVEQSDAPFTAQSEEEAYVPAFARTREVLKGAAYGTAFHKVMELLDEKMFELTDKVNPGEPQIGEHIQAIDEWMKEKAAKGRMPEAYTDSVRAEDVYSFLLSSLGLRMANAFQKGKLYRERPFVLGLPAKRLKPSYPEGETVLIQGIIDAYFIEDDQIVLVDYKTDHLDHENDFVGRYKVQLDYYEEALQRITGMTVKEKLIYSSGLRQVIHLK